MGPRLQENFVTGRQGEGALWKAERRLIPVRGSNWETRSAEPTGAGNMERD